MEPKQCFLPNKVSRLIGFSLSIKEWGRGNTQQTVTGHRVQRPGDRKGRPDLNTVKSSLMKPEHSEIKQSCFFIFFLDQANLR